MEKTEYQLVFYSFIVEFPKLLIDIGESLV